VCVQCARFPYSNTVSAATACSTHAFSPAGRSLPMCTILVVFTKGVACRVFSDSTLASMCTSGSSWRTIDVNPITPEQKRAHALFAAVDTSPTIPASRKIWVTLCMPVFCRERQCRGKAVWKKWAWRLADGCCGVRLALHRSPPELSGTPPTPPQRAAPTGQPDPAPTYVIIWHVSRREGGRRERQRERASERSAREHI
jgi:hypothetical protein